MLAVCCVVVVTWGAFVLCASAVFNAISPQCLKTFELHEMVLPKRNVGNDLSQPQSEQHHPCKQQLLLQCQQDGHVLQDQKRC
jgi:hypothetical protein